MTSRRAALAGAVLAALLSGCQDGARAPVVSADPAPSAYDGPMAVGISGDADAPLLERVGAAGRALECAGQPAYLGERGFFGAQLEAVRADAEEVLEEFLRDGRGWTLPGSGYARERSADRRVLFSYDVEGRTKVAFVAVGGKKDSQGREGWAMEAWAMCDPSHLPDEVTEALGYGVWEDRTGRRVPLSTAHSFNGDAHCDWEDVTFLRHGGRTYVRDPSGELADFLTGRLGRDESLPRTARDTGLRRDGMALWVDPPGNAAYLVRAGSGNGERWPAERQPIACA